MVYLVLLLVLSIVRNWYTKDTDFSNVFAQEDMSGEDVYISIPSMIPGFSKSQYLLIKKSLYGQANAPQRWYEKLMKGLQDCSFSPFPADLCLFVSSKVICTAYVDYCL